MDVTLISGDRAVSLASAHAHGEDLWLSFDDVAAATGWEPKPQGMCRGETCVPLPHSRRGEFVDGENRLNVAAFARYLGQPVVHDEAEAAWLIGESAELRVQTLRSLEAPDFRLPDLDGNLHALSDYRGKKVLLLSWASW
jgi:hypothetical protein